MITLKHSSTRKFRPVDLKNASEVIRAGLRLLEEEEAKVIALNNAIAEGIESGVAKQFDPQKHLEKLKAARRKNG